MRGRWCGRLGRRLHRHLRRQRLRTSPRPAGSRTRSRARLLLHLRGIAGHWKRLTTTRSRSEVIEPEFLAALRRRHRCEPVLLMVQLEQLCPGWWVDLTQLAEQLGTDRATINRSMVQLERLDLIRRFSLSNGGGTWVWWVKRSTADEPRPQDEPSWLIRDHEQQQSRRIPVSERFKWADAHGIPRQTMRSFLAGNQRLLRGRWELRATPLDCERL